VSSDQERAMQIAQARLEAARLARDEAGMAKWRAEKAYLEAFDFLGCVADGEADAIREILEDHQKPST